MRLGGEEGTEQSSQWSWSVCVFNLLNEAS